MPQPDLTQLAKSFYATFAEGDRERAEELLAPDFTFSSPLDVGLDREGFFTRCWSGAGRRQQFHLLRAHQVGDEVIVTYEQTKPDGRAFRNTEVLTFRDSQMC